MLGGSGSKHGPWKFAEQVDFLNMGGDGTTGSAAPLSGWKSETLEGGMRVPAIMRWPGRLPAGTTCDGLATAMDLMPTFAGYAGADVPADRVVDGVDISGIMEEPKSEPPHDFFYYYSFRTEKLNAVRDADGYKLHLWKEELDLLGVSEPYEGEKLYFLPDDAGERNDISADHPGIVERLRAAAGAFDAGLIENSRPVGNTAGRSGPR